MASDGTGTRLMGMPIGMAVGIVGLVVTMGVVGFLWKGQIEGMGAGASALGVDGGRGPNAIIDSTKLTSTIIKLRGLGSQLDHWRVQYGYYPPDLSHVRGRPGNPSDAWGAEMIYTPEGNSVHREGMQMWGSFQLVSRGQDGLLDTGDDLVFADGMVKGGIAPTEGVDEPGGQVAAETGGGMVDPGPSSTALPAGQRALSAARDIAASANSQSSE